VKLGVFAKTYQRASLDGTLDAIQADGLELIQFNMAAVGLPTLPDHVPQETIDRILRAIESRTMTIAAISATYNMAHPDQLMRDQGLTRLLTLARAAQKLGVPTLTLCTGTRNRDDIWSHHPDNDTPEAWEAMRNSIVEALDIADRFDLSLAIEPEAGNIACNAERARILLDQCDHHPRLRVILDPANIVDTDPLRPPAELIAEAVDLLGPFTIMAHAKDSARHGTVRPPGKGIVPWDLFLHRLNDIGFDGPLLMHGFEEAEIPASLAFLSERFVQLCD
jgi:sugar phosphate isomerase/epimerase